MIFLTAEALELHQIPYRAADSIEFENKLFSRGASFSKRIFQRIIAELQQDNLQEGANSLVVEVGEHFTVWHEVKLAQLNLVLSVIPAEPPSRQPADRLKIPSVAATQPQISDFLTQEASSDHTQVISLQASPAPQELAPAPFEMAYRGVKYQITRT